MGRTEEKQQLNITQFISLNNNDDDDDDKFFSLRPPTDEKNGWFPIAFLEDN